MQGPVYDTGGRWSFASPFTSLLPRQLTLVVEGQTGELGGERALAPCVTVPSFGSCLLLYPCRYIVQKLQNYK